MAGGDESAAGSGAGREPDVGVRLAAQERRLRLLLAHLTGRALRARVELDDLIQEVYLRALSDPEALPPHEPGEARLAGHLRVLAQRAVIDLARFLRTRKRSAGEEPLLRSDWSRAPAARAPGPHTEAAGAETSRALARAFLALPPEHRRVIGLRQFEGLSAEEAGRRMGRSASAVHSLYRRALSSWEETLGRIPGSRDESPRAARPGAP